ncbi:hypothetical protein JL09_g5223 [Pichia kudriavzevii]|uniref:Uncharacterized protein n=1 Tax=Pichia kudriavzevii TaxID=4909 RepID=A0A099NUN4_PICKU|nr:hypothetical protein JL09_g5223 [Pichia kudriavzevii]
MSSPPCSSDLKKDDKVLSKTYVLIENTQVQNTPNKIAPKYTLKLPDAYGLLHKEAKATHTPTQTVNTSSKFPETFNPRKEQNMPHKQKVDEWILQVPVAPLNIPCDLWSNECYKPYLEFAEAPETLIDNDVNMSTDSAVIEVQSKLITTLTNREYYKENELVRRYDGRADKEHLYCVYPEIENGMNAILIGMQRFQPNHQTYRGMHPYGFSGYSN